MNASLHELIRGNVVLATRFFNHRVKKFFHTIVLGHNTPMNVQYYTYKVEFQERGAGHIHGTLWLNLSNLEKLTRSINGDLINGESYNQESIETMPSRPFENMHLKS